MTKTIGSAVLDATRQLSLAGVDGADLDARILMSSVLKVAPHQASLLADNFLDETQLEKFGCNPETPKPRTCVIYLGIP
jgi:hypothetical protein